MKKLNLLCTMAVLLAGGSVSLFAADVQITGTGIDNIVQDVNTNYYFNADGQKFITRRGDNARHVEASVYFYLNGYDVTLEAIHTWNKYANDSTDAGKNTLGFRGVHFVGNADSSITLTVGDGGTPVWISDASRLSGVAGNDAGINLEGGATLYLNYGEKISQYQGNSKIKIADGSTVVQNTRRVADSTTLFQFVRGTGDISTGGNVLFTQESLTTGTSKGSAIVNTTLGIDITAKFDNSFAEGSTVNFVTDIASGVAYNNTFALDGQNVNIYAKNATVGLTVTNSSSTKSQVYVEAGTIELTSGKLTADANSSLYLKGKLVDQVDSNGKVTAASVINASGGGAKTIELTENSKITGSYTSSVSGAVILVKSADDTQKTLEMANRINIAGGFSLENVKFLIKNSGGGNGGNNTIKLEMDSKSAFETYGGLRIHNGSDIAGSILVKGTGNSANKDADGFKLAISGGGSDSAIIRSTAVITQKYDSSVTSASQAKNWISIGALTIEDGAKLQFEDKIRVFGSKIILEGSNAFNVGMDGENFNSQAKSTITIENNSGTTPSSQTRTEFVINAANELGSFEFSQDNHLLTLSFGANGSLTIGEDAGLISFCGDFFGEGVVLIKGDVFNKLKVYDLDFDSNEGLKSRFKAEDDRVLTFINNGDGSYFINTVVPEPAEWAAIFGAIALAFVFIRKRK